MSKRIVWFVAGAAAGVGGATYGRRKARQAAEKLTPTNVAKSTVARVKGRAHDVADAVRDGRRAAHDKEAELKAARDRDMSTVVDAELVDPLAALTNAPPGGTTINYIVVSPDRDMAEVLPNIGATGSVRASTSRRRRSRRG
ncbi:MAG TPA: hypothetical protein VF855_12715 [Acidimicrobiales bacterium]